MGLHFDRRLGIPALAALALLIAAPARADYTARNDQIETEASRVFPGCTFEFLSGHPKNSRAIVARLKRLADIFPGLTRMLTRIEMSSLGGWPTPSSRGYHIWHPRQNPERVEVVFRLSKFKSPNAGEAVYVLDHEIGHLVGDLIDWKGDREGRAALKAKWSNNPGVAEERWAKAIQEWLAKPWPSRLERPIDRFLEERRALLASGPEPPARDPSVIPTEQP